MIDLEQMKRCTICSKEKPLDEFYLSLHGTEGQCKKCRDQAKYQHRIEQRIARGLPVKTLTTRQSRELFSKGLRYCPTCKRVLPLNDFSTRRAGTKIAPHCKECTREWSLSHQDTLGIKKKEKYKKEREKRRDSILRTRFGINLMEYNALLDKQHHQCIICGLTDATNGKALAVDHNHKTGTIRGLLCNNCNVCVGFLKDKPEIAVSIAKYLTEEVR